MIQILFQSSAQCFGPIWGDLELKVTVQFRVRVSWLIETKLKGQSGMKGTKFKDKDGRGVAWLMPVALALEPYVMIQT